jgi:protein-tyrosine phosphatase
MSTPFVIAPIPAPPGTLALCPLPGAAGAFDADLAQIAAFAPALVLSMTEAQERHVRGAGALPDRLAALGIDWAAFPVPDFGTPPSNADWATLAARAHAVLDAGGRVLAHCRGGKGRSGMVVLRLMIERGADPDAALETLREARPGAVETDAQEAWARAV